MEVKIFLKAYFQLDPNTGLRTEKEILIATEIFADEGGEE